jgi:hypothetical protein
MRLKAWREFPHHILHPDIKTAIRDGEFRIPNNNAKRSFPAIRMIVTNLNKTLNGYEIYLEDSEYSMKISYGKNFESLEQAKFVADIKLIELGHEIEEPFLLEVKVSNIKTDGVISDEDCYFTCIVCNQKARKVDSGRCIECYNKEFDNKTGKRKAKPHIDRFLANDPVDW